MPKKVKVILRYRDPAATLSWRLMTAASATETDNLSFQFLFIGKGKQPQP